MKRVVVIPTYNEADNIEPLVHTVRETMPELDIVVVDDGSPDGTGDIATGMDGVRVIQRGAKLGLGTAYVAGFTHALQEGYGEIGSMDADFSHDPKELPALFGLLADHDVAVGTRYIPGGGTKNWGLHRRILSRTSNHLARLTLGLPTHDNTSAYRCYRRTVLENIQLHTIRSDGYSFLVELLYRCVRLGYSVGETPILFEDRRMGVTKINRSEILKGALTLLRLRLSSFPPT